ncbi:leucyl aminopeptidase family protein [Rhizobiaceae bacterium]|nr:leucyl aminopeptidase family protein [Rhizobiaceae bacterium]
MHYETDPAAPFGDEGEAIPIRFLDAAGYEPQGWAKALGFAAKPGEHCLVPDADGNPVEVLFGNDPDDPLAVGTLARVLPAGNYRLGEGAPEQAQLAWGMGAYSFDRYRKGRSTRPVLAGTLGTTAKRLVETVYIARDLINIPANDMGPDALEAAFRKLSERHRADVTVTTGDALLPGFPMVHAVGRASVQAPRVLDMVWGRAEAPRITLVGKGVTFDTGGLNIKPGASMALMKKDMGGAANVMALAHAIMDAKLPVRLRLIVGAVENAIAGNAFRPGDVLPSRKGITVEIGNTDAEGRLVLGDCLALADEEAPDLLIDMATLTGAARVALGPDLPPFFTHNDAFAATLSAHGNAVADPLWRMPLWKPYQTMLSSKIADVNHISTGGFAGCITAALFLDRFVEQARTWAHFDIFGWVPAAKPSAPVGGEALAIRALYAHLADRYPA